MNTDRPKLVNLRPSVQLLQSGPKPLTQQGKWGDSRRGSRHERGYGTAWDKLRLVIFKRDKYLCQCEHCKAAHRVRPAHAVDHILEKADGGSDATSNLQAINRECHQRKTREAFERRTRGAG